MIRNSFKFLTLALAASLTVAPISAIDWNSGSTRVGVGIAVFGIVCAVVYKYWFSNKKEDNLPFSPISPETRQVLDNLPSTGGTEVNSKSSEPKIDNNNPAPNRHDSQKSNYPDKNAQVEVNASKGNQGKDDAQTVRSNPRNVSSDSTVTEERLKRMGAVKVFTVSKNQTQYQQNIQAVEADKSRLKEVERKTNQRQKKTETPVPAQ